MRTNLIISRYVNKSHLWRFSSYFYDFLELHSSPDPAVCLPHNVRALASPWCWGGASLCPPSPSASRAGRTSVRRPLLPSGCQAILISFTWIFLGHQTTIFNLNGESKLYTKSDYLRLLVSWLSQNIEATAPSPLILALNYLYVGPCDANINQQCM